MKAINETIKQLKKLILDPNCERMNRSIIKGYLGELLVLKKLSKEGLNINHKGNQSGFDLEVDGRKIDVKFSPLKNEMKNFPKYWGWALKNKSKTKPLSCSHFICVAVDNYLNVKNYYVINKKDLHRFDNKMTRFRNVEKGFLLLPKLSRIPKDTNKELKKYFQKCHKLVRQGIVKKAGPNQRLSNIIF